MMKTADNKKIMDIADKLQRKLTAFKFIWIVIRTVNMEVTFPQYWNATAIATTLEFILQASHISFNKTENKGKWYIYHGSHRIMWLKIISFSNDNIIVNAISQERMKIKNYIYQTRMLTNH